MTDNAGERLGHVAAAPIGPPQPVADIGAGAALNMVGGLYPHADDADRLMLEPDHQTRLGILGSERRLPAHEASHVLARVRPGRRTRPADHLPCRLHPTQRLLP